ncbi:zf-HC2 domain-containing protein [Streptomyces sp. MRC013]|uniref:zf-HC2 domain-containing protein n=1 Tax=Streptomyces sp. MRC013 TaxID=2898276 RepID=UPI0020268F0D|nr:zf-HC2 domain-containing protein [Streptomyces sp. MRC013]URM89750.1 zf-HC2 domain-containing protein [Streptomyces sp. MRC013]
MSGARPTPAEHHLGDRLAALVDGELGHDARERVLAHLATCARCKAEADAQRRVKSFFAESAPPPPPAGLLARLQGLPGGSGGPPFADGGPGTGPRRTGSPPDTTGRPGPDPFRAGPGGFGHLPAGGRAPSARGGFRIHQPGREVERSVWLGRRFAFAAASAVSFAAIALGGAIPTAGVVEARGEAPGSSVTPLRSPSAGQPAAPLEGPRRRSTASAGPGRFADRPGPLLPGAQVRTGRPTAPPFLHAVSPLIGAGALPLASAPDPVPVSRRPSYRTPPATVSGTPAHLVESTVGGAGRALSGQ